MRSRDAAQLMIETEPTAASSTTPQSGEGMVELLKAEHAIYLERGEFCDAKLASGISSDSERWNQ